MSSYFCIDVIVAASAHLVLHIRFPLRKVLLQWLSAGIPFALLTWALPAGGHIVLSILACLVFGLTYLVLSINIGAWEDSDLAMLSQNSRHLGRLLSWVSFRKPVTP